MIQFFMKGGPLMWPILISSLWALTIILERAFHFHRAKIKTGSFTDRVRQFISEKNPDEAEELCKQTPGPVARVVEVAIHERRKKDAETRIFPLPTCHTQRLSPRYSADAHPSTNTPHPGLWSPGSF